MSLKPNYKTRSTDESDRKADKKEKRELNFSGRRTNKIERTQMKNLIEKAEEEIKSVLYSDLTSYEIGKRSGISNQVIDRYRKGTNLIENMTFKTAKKLLELKYIKKER